MSTAARASFDLSSLQMTCVVITHTERLTCAHVHTNTRITSCLLQSLYCSLHILVI